MNDFSQPVTVFQELHLPEAAILSGYAALIARYNLKVPLPSRLCAIGPKHKNYEQGQWRLFSPRYQPDTTLEGQLIFALKYEGLDLGVLKALFEAVGSAAIVKIVRAKPTSSYLRRLWFLYEWLLEETIDCPDVTTGSYVDVLDEKQQFGVSGEKSKRHRVRNNLPGTHLFCPLVRRTQALEDFIAEDLRQKAMQIIGKISSSVLARTAAFLLLKDSKSSFEIENETSAHTRIQRWGRAIGEAGKNPLSTDEFIRLQHIVIGDGRFTKIGFRDEGGFIGSHDRDTRMPLPVHISARHDDVPGLIEGLISFEQQATADLDPVIAAAILAFGFVNIHPFEDGNGRLHRYLIHHMLAANSFNPPGLIFPVSSVILNRIDEYAAILENYSQKVLPLIQWKPTDQMNVHVLNETRDLYSYFDATEYAEFLYSCVKQTIEDDLPREAAFLENYDRFKGQVENIVEMPDSLIDLLFGFLKQNSGELSKRARSKEFSELTDSETATIEEAYKAIFGE